MSNLDNGYIEEYTENDDELVTKLSDELLFTNIEEQVKNPLISKNNILDIFESRFNYIINNYADNDLIISNCKKVRADLYSRVLELMENELHFKTDFEDRIQNDDYFFFIKGLYEFFVVNYKENVINYFYNTILRMKKSLISNFKNNLNKKDLYYKSLKKYTDDLDTIVLVYNIYDIFNFIRTLNEVKSEDIIDLIITGNEYRKENSIVSELFLNDEVPYEAYLNKDFLLYFLDDVSVEGFSFEITNELKNRLIYIK